MPLPNSFRFRLPGRLKSITRGPSGRVAGSLLVFTFDNHTQVVFYFACGGGGQLSRLLVGGSHGHHLDRVLDEGVLMVRVSFFFPGWVGGGLIPHFSSLYMISHIFFRNDGTLSGPKKTAGVTAALRPISVI